MLVSSREVLGLGGCVRVDIKFPLIQKHALFPQPQTPSHLVEDLQDVIKQESDESGVVAEFQENGPPLLKKIKQEVSLTSVLSDEKKKTFMKEKKKKVERPCCAVDSSLPFGNPPPLTPLE